MAGEVRGARLWRRAYRPRRPSCTGAHLFRSFYSRDSATLFMSFAVIALDKQHPSSTAPRFVRGGRNSGGSRDGNRGCLATIV
jgi:hypothetical protein